MNPAAPASFDDPVIVLRGAGEMATGCAAALVRAGFRRVVLLETSSPRAVRRRVCLSEAVFEGRAVVEEIEARLVRSTEEVERTWKDATFLPLRVDPEFDSRTDLLPNIVIDATLRKAARDTHPGLAALVIGLGPGMLAGRDCHVVIETQRGPTLGRLIRDGSALADTGQPAEVDGHTSARILKVATGGLFRTSRNLGDRVAPGDPVAEIRALSGERVEVKAEIAGTLRGLLRDGTAVAPFEKLGDIDPTADRSRLDRISDKALTIGRSVVEAIRDR